MNKKGFTLVELLAVIIILSLLALLASTSVTKIVTNSKSELYSAQISLIEEAAKSWGADNLEKLPSENGQCEYITLRKLKEYGLLEENIINPKTNKEFSDDLKIKITSNISMYNSLIIDYEADPSDTSGCEPTYVCELINDADNSKSVTAGDKYICEVKEGTSFNFYVLNTPTDENINLIMERNVYYDSTNDIGSVATEANTGTVVWYSSGSDNSYGPVTAMNYLYNATKDWSNIPNIIMNYEDENINYTTQEKGTNGYGSIKTTNGLTQITRKDGTVVTVLTDQEGYSNLKARMPRYDEVHGEGKCLTYAENGNQYGSCPLWLSNYLKSSSNVIGENLQNISGIYGYWTLSSSANNSLGAWYVYYDGVIGNYFNIEYDCGVRPVITIPKSELG